MQIRRDGRSALTRRTPGIIPGMINRLYVHNYRCLENFELQIAERPTSLLIGKNGAGKSTIGWALEIFQKIGRGTNRISDLVSRSDFARGRSDIPIRFELEAKIGERVFEFALALELPIDFKELRVLEERLAVDGLTLYSRSGAQVLLTGTKKEREAKFLVDWHLVALPLIQEQSTADPLYIFKTWLKQMLILAPIPCLMSGDSEGETLTPDSRCTDFGAWFTGLLAQSPAAYTWIDEYLKGVMPDFKDIQNPLVGKDSRSLTVQFQMDQARLSLPFASLSDGEKCFFICALIVASNQAYGPIFCFWDEPDDYLSLAEIGQLMLALRRSFQNRGQLLTTSHNPETMRKFSDDDILVLDRHSHLEPTIIRPLSDIQINGNLEDALIRGDVAL